jgi:hypothetical protein
MKLKVPFRLGRFIIEKEVDFIFKIATLEIATLEILKIDLNQITTKSADEVNIAVLYAGYITACKDSYKKPKYKESHAAFWAEQWSKKTENDFRRALSEMIGSWQTIGEDKKKVIQDGKNSDLLQSENSDGVLNDGEMQHSKS